MKHWLATTRWTKVQRSSSASRILSSGSFRKTLNNRLLNRELPPLSNSLSLTEMKSYPCKFMIYRWRSREFT